MEAIGVDSLAQTEGSESNVVTAQYDWSRTSPLFAAVQTLAEADDCDVSDVGRLYEYVDPDALNSLLHADSREDNSGIVVSFTYDERDVTVDGSGTVVVG